MKNMKKLVVLILSVLMVLGTTMVTSFADAPTTGSVTVNPNYKGQTYKLYKLFDAQITFKEEDGTYTQRAITYTLPEGKTLAAPATDWFEVNSNGFVVKKDALTPDVMKSAAFRTWVKSFGTQQGEAKKAASDNDANVKWESIPFGYYFVDSTLGALVGVDSDNPNVTIQDKNSLPSVDKEIVSTTSGVVGNDPTKATTETDHGTNEAATAQVGDTVTYKVTVAAKPGAENYVVKDTLSAGLTAPAAADVTVTGLEKGEDKDYTVNVAGQVITVTFTKAYLDSITEAKNLVINYTAVLNSNAVIGAAGNPNTVKLTWGHDNEDNHSEDDAKVYTAQISAIKTDNQSPAQPLAGAGFVLKNADNKYYKLANGVVTWVDTEVAADEHISAADGAVAAFTGLPNGSYTLVEKTVPDGYNKLEDKTFTITGTDYTDANLKKSATVVNNAGTELPSTGGMGTTILYIIGGVLVAVSAIMLVAKKRTSDK